MVTLLHVPLFSIHLMSLNIPFRYALMVLQRKKSFLRTMPSTLKKLKKIAQDLTPKFAICEASSAVGGLTTASSAGELPRNRQQVSNIQRRKDSDDVSLCKHKDPLHSHDDVQGK